MLEVGPGLGSLTLALLDAAAAVVAVEIDPVLAAALPGTVAERRAGRRRPARGVLAQDALTADRARRPPSPTALVANLPYNVAVPVLLHLLELLPTLRHGLVMVQAEVADRLARRPGRTRLRRAVGEGGLVRATSRRAGAVPPVGVLAGAERRLRAGRVHPARPPAAAASRRAVFAVRRRRLRAAAQDAAGRAGRAGPARPDAAERALRAAGIDPRTRGEQLAVSQFARWRHTARPTQLEAGPSGERAPRVTVRAPAKVNLRLEVGAAHADGYHALATVFHAVSLLRRGHRRSGRGRGEQRRPGPR